MRPLRSISLILLFILAPLASGVAQQGASVNAAKAKAIRQLLEVSHSSALMAGAIAVSIRGQREANPQVPTEIWDLMQKKVGEMIPQLVDSLLPIYDRHFSQEEIELLIQFYTTPIGQRLLAEQVAITTESGEAGRKWGLQIGQQIVDSLAHASP